MYAIINFGNTVRILDVMYVRTLLLGKGCTHTHTLSLSLSLSFSRIDKHAA